MRIALITNYWKNSDGGGVRNYVVNLVDALRAKDNEVDVLFREGDDPEQFQAGKNKVKFFTECYRHLCKIRPEVVHSQGTWYCLLPGVLYKRLHGCKLVHTFHTAPVTALSPPAKLFFQSLLDQCDCVTFVSKGLQNKVVEVDGLSFPRTAITYAGVRAREVAEQDIEQFREQYSIDEDAVVLLALGMTAHPLKAEGLKLLLRAVSILQEDHPDIILIVTREGRYSDELRDFAHEVGVGAHVVFTGDIENPFVPLKLCDIYVHTSLGEGLPIALLEAMAMGKPIVATPVEGIPEAVVHEKNGLLVAPEVGQIAESVDYLLKNMEYAEKLGRCAKETVENSFTWEQAAERFLLIFIDAGD